MKCSRAAVHRKSHRLPEVRFEDQRLTSFAGLFVFQPLFNRLGLKGQLTGCFRHLKVSPTFGHGLTVLLLIVHPLLGCRREGEGWRLQLHHASLPMVPAKSATEEPERQLH